MEHLMAQTRKELDLRDKSKKPSLDELTLSDLKVLYLRQEKLLGNPLIAKNLPDGGDKLRAHLSSIEATMRLKEEYDGAVLALGDLKIEEHPPPVSSLPPERRLSPPKIMDSDKLERVRDRIRTRAPSTTKLLTGEEVLEIASREKPKEEGARESGPRLGDFFGMFKMGNVQAKCGEEGSYRVRIEGDDSDSCSEVSDHSRTSEGDEYGLSDELGLLEDCLYDNTA